jgi:MraZ protein
MFLGEYQHTLDAKGRVSLPIKFRYSTGGQIVVSKGLEECLYVYPATGYQALLDKLMAGGDFDRNIRALRRFFIAGASETDVDSAGRIAITPALRAHAGLTKDVVVAGVGDHIELWDAAKWAAYENDQASTIEDAAEELVRQGVL